MELGKAEFVITIASVMRRFGKAMRLDEVSELSPYP